MSWEKNISHIHFLDAAEQSENCPICLLARKSVEKYIDDMLYENVNDGILRKKINLSKGFCAKHSEMILKHGDALGIAILHTDLMKLLIESLNHSNINLKEIFSGKRDNIEWCSHDNCPICLISIESEERYISIFLELLENEKNFLDNFIQHKTILCAKHLIFSIEKMPSNTIKDTLLSYHLSRYKEILNDLNEFCRKNNFRFKDEPISNDEATSWKKAVEIISSKNF